MSWARERDAVLRLLRSENLETVSRSFRVTAATLSGWRDAFLAAGWASRASRQTDGEALESERLKAWLGEMLPEARIAAREGGRPLARRRPRS
jgi:transposase